MYITVREGRAIIKIPDIKKISKKLPVFYNPAMKLNRDISVLILGALNKKDMQICLPLAGSGIRGIRFLLELNKNIIKTIYFNDINKKAYGSIKANLRLNNIKINNKIIIKNKDANLFLLENFGFDYIDIDPFGTPNPFLDAACRRIARDGILAVTATDTAALTGTYPKTCMRKYWAVPKRDGSMHETGLRILIRKCQLVGMQYEKALIPIFSFYKEHYFRVFFKCVKDNNMVNGIIRSHELRDGAGPLWAGKLWDSSLVKKINLKKITDKEGLKFIKIIKEESKIGTIGFYNLHKLSERYKFRLIKSGEIIKRIKSKGYQASLTHFSGHGIRSDIGLEELIRLLKR